MTENNQIDQKEKPSQSRLMIAWWEKKRLLYNLIILIPTSFLYASRFSSNSDQVGAHFYKLMVFVNVLYTFSWMFGWINHKFSDVPYESSKTRWVVFYTGVVLGLLTVNVPVLLGI